MQAQAEIGSTANSYEILAKLATGGMAEIFLARGASGAGIERYVVLKRVLRHKAADEHFVRMFLDEARLAAQLQHPNIAQVYDLGKLGDSYFFTMEYVHGETVRALINRSAAMQRPIPIAAVLSISAGAAAGLHHAHERKDTAGRPLHIVHRDVSPSNLMLSYEGAVKVVDFGVAKASHRSQETASGAVKGKIAYLSPEQCRASPDVDRRSDLFSLGIVMWELLTLQRLYRRASDFEQMIAISQEPPPPPSSRRPDVPRELDELVLKLLAKDRNDRFQTADELHAALEDIAVRLGSALSTASLGRFVRELFGHRPEPWIELRTEDLPRDGVTVTSEPLPANLAIPPADSVDLELGAVPDLSISTESSASGPVPADMQVTLQRPLVSPEPSRSEPVRTLPMPTVAPPPTVAMSLPDAPRPRSRKTGLIVLASLVAVSAGLAIIIAVSGGGHTVGRDDVATVVHAPPPPAPPAPAADAAPAVEVAPPDAAVEVAAAPPPLPAEVKTPPTERPRHRQPPPSPPPPKASPGEDLNKQYEDTRYSDVVATCVANAALADKNPTTCVLAACHVHDAAHAKKWTKAAGGKRAALVAACAALNTPLEEAKPKDCGDDPLSCQH